MRKYILLVILLLAFASSATKASADTFDLKDFGAVGDGQTDDGPALQSALDALAQAGGGTLFVPQGRYAIITPVFKDFSGLASSVTILGVESSAPIDNTADGSVLAEGLDLVSEFAPMTGEADIAVSVSGLQHFLIKDIGFVGTPDVETDAKITLALDQIEDATITHCEFYGLISKAAGGAIVLANRSRLRIELSKFLGSSGNSAVNVPVVQNLRWKGSSVTDSTFLDYGNRQELYGKTGIGTPLSWINVGNAEPVSSDSPRREVVLNNVFLDEGALVGVFVIPHLYQPASAPIDLVSISRLRMNVCNLDWSGNFLLYPKAVFIEKSRYMWSQYADAAINLQTVGTAILDELECVDGANRIRADASTERVSVINSVYTYLDSDAQTTDVINTAAEDDPVQYVRRQFETMLNRGPDPAGHFYWSDRILRCGSDAECVAATHADLDSYLSGAPSPTFSIAGRAADAEGNAFANLTVSLSGAQTVAAQTDADGRYRFSDLPTSGVYTVSTSKDHFTFIQPNFTFTTPSGDQTADFTAALNAYSITGQIVDADNTGMMGITVTLTGGMSMTATTDANGYFAFDNLPALESYTVTPSLEDHSFQPSSWTINELTDDHTTDIVGIHDTHAIQGRVTRADGSSISGVNVNLSGSQAAATISDSGGNYSFANLPAGGAYTIAVSKNNYSFTPQSLMVSDLSASEAANFTGALVNYTLSGRITSGETALAGVTVNVSGSKSSTTSTDAGGDYSFSVTAEGNYTVTPAKTHYTFSPASVSLNNLGANRKTDFSATLSRHNISGRVTEVNGTGLSGVTVSLSGSQAATAITNASGDYSFSALPAGGNYTVTVAKTHYTFQPSSQTFNNLSLDKLGAFVAMLQRHTISGRVTRTDGSAISGVDVTLSGASTSTSVTATDSNGNYSFASCAAGGNYTISVSKTHYSFDSQNNTVGELGGDYTANFTGQLVSYELSGQVTVNGVALADVTLTVSGSQNAAATAGADGSYSIMVPAEGNYTVTPSSPKYTFNPTSVAISNLSGNSVGNFSATLRSGVPVLISEEGSTRALAFDSVLQTREPFQLNYSYPWTSDRRTRLMLFAMNFELASNETAAAVTAEGEDGSHLIYPLTVEYVGKVSGINWLNCIVVRLDDSLGDVGDILVRVTYRGVSSNRVRIGMGHIGGGLPDDAGAVATPGRAPQ